jgi:hypothetical protein
VEVLRALSPDQPTTEELIIMSITFEVLSAEEIQSQNNLYWEGALAALQTPVLNDGDDVSPVSYLMPYFTAYRTYEKHVERCTACSESIYAECSEGDALAHIAADATAAQSDLAGQN